MNVEEIESMLTEVHKLGVTPLKYESVIDEFDVYPCDDYQKMYYTIGFNGEYDELLEKIFGLQVAIRGSEKWHDLCSEGGDVCWYVTRLANAFNIRLSDIYPNGKKITRNFDDLMKNVHKSKKDLTESVKKFYRDGNGNLTLEWKERIFYSLCDLYIDLEDLARVYDITLNDMMVSNLLKLGVRKIKDNLHGDGDKR